MKTDIYNMYLNDAKESTTLQLDDKIQFIQNAFKLGDYESDKAVNNALVKLSVYKSELKKRNGAKIFKFNLFGFKITIIK